MLNEKEGEGAPQKFVTLLARDGALDEPVDARILSPSDLLKSMLPESCKEGREGGRGGGRGRKRRRVVIVIFLSWAGACGGEVGSEKEREERGEGGRKEGRGGER